MPTAVGVFGTYSGYVAISFLPALVWLLFYLQEDRHPEPKHLILLTFVAGVISAVAAVAVEVFFFGQPPRIPLGITYRIFPQALDWPIVVIAGVPFIEEYLKYLAVKFSVLSRADFDEPVDAMIYMVTAALGFAAIENVAFLIDVFEQSFIGGVELTVTRFLGANLLHTLSSAIVGYFLARHVFSPWRRHAVFFGVILASVLHMLFNYFIINRGVVTSATEVVVLLLTFMAIVVFVDFERLKRAGVAANTKATGGGAGPAAGKM